MTLKSLFIKLVGEDTKRRLWTVALASLVFFFMFPVWAALLVSRYLNPDRINAGWDNTQLGLQEMKLQLMERFLNWISIESGLLVFVMILFAVICAVSGFSYLHSRRKTDFFHSIPVKREKLFAVTYLNGILYIAIPYFISLVAASLLVQIKASSPIEWGTVFTSYLIHISFYVLVYSTTVVAVILTGNTLVSLMGTLVFFLWGPGVTLLTYGYFSVYFDTFFDNQIFLEQFTRYSSPVSWYISFLSENTGAVATVFWVLAAAAVLTAIAVFLYKKRPSEAAGRAMAFKKSQPIIKILIVVPAALFSSLFFLEMRGGDGWSIFGLICGIGISYCIVEIIYNFDFRRLFAHKKQLAVCTLISAAILAFFRFDMPGYDSYIPSADRIESCGVYIRYLDGETAYDYRVEPKLTTRRSGIHDVEFTYEREVEELLREMELLNTEDVLTIARSGIEDVKTRSMRRLGFREYVGPGLGEPLVNRETVIIEYHLKNGKNVYRSYSMDLTPVEPAINTVYSQKEYKEAVYPVLKLNASDIAGINYQEYREYRNVKLPDALMKEKIITAYKEELMALTTDTRRQESPIAAIQFKTNEIQGMIDLLRKEGNFYTVFNDYYYYPIYPSFTKTISLLKECGIEAGRFLTVENVEKIEIAGNLKEEILPSHVYGGKLETTTDVDINGSTVIVKDKKQIQEILNASISRDLPFYNNLYPVSNISITAFVPVEMLEDMPGEFTGDSGTRTDGATAEYKTYSLVFGTDHIPDFVRKELQ